MTGQEVITWIKETGSENLPVFRMTDDGCGEQREVKMIRVTKEQWTDENIIEID